MPLGVLTSRHGAGLPGSLIEEEVASATSSSAASGGRTSLLLDEELSPTTDCSEDSVEIRPTGVVRPSAKRILQRDICPPEEIKRSRLDPHHPAALTMMMQQHPATQHFLHPPLTAGLMDLERIGLLQHWGAAAMMMKSPCWPPSNMDASASALYPYPSLLPYTYFHPPAVSAYLPFYPVPPPPVLPPTEDDRKRPLSSASLPPPPPPPRPLPPADKLPPAIVTPRTAKPARSKRPLPSTEEVKPVPPTPPVSFSVETLLKRIAPEDPSEDSRVMNRHDSGAIGGSGNGTSNGSRNYKNMTRERRMQANARERSRVHTISAAFEALRKAVPSFSHGQRLSKLSILRVASAYIAALGGLAGDGDSDTNDVPDAATRQAVDRVTRTLMTEGQMIRRKQQQHKSNPSSIGQHPASDCDDCDLVDED